APGQVRLRRIHDVLRSASPQRGDWEICDPLSVAWVLRQRRLRRSRLRSTPALSRAGVSCRRIDSSARVTSSLFWSASLVTESAAAFYGMAFGHGAVIDSDQST